jgi:electron transport complex protein RnfG
MKHILKPALALFIITAIATALLGLARDFTLEPIKTQHKKTQEKAMKEVLPSASVFNDISAAQNENIFSSGSINRIFEGVANGQTVGYVVELSPVGYSGAINMMVGISNTQNRITGMRVLKHSETPGLGALAVKEKFYSRFNNKKLVTLNVVKIPTGAENEIEAITASTITTRAVTNAVNEAIEWYLKEELK